MMKWLGINNGCFGLTEIRWKHTEYQFLLAIHWTACYNGVFHSETNLISYSYYKRVQIYGKAITEFKMYVCKSHILVYSDIEQEMFIFSQT